jgi:AcrR family transcriptional regulator
MATSFPPTDESTRESPAPPVRRRLAPEERRRELLDSAFEIVLHRGLESLTMEGLAAQAGVNKALPYHYFETREGVLIALTNREYTRILDAFESAAHAATGLDAKLQTLIESWIDLAPQWRVIRGLETIRPRSADLDAILRGYETRIAQVIAGVFAAELGMRADKALMVASAVIGSAQGIVWAREITGWSRKRTVAAWLTMSVVGTEALSSRKAER